MFLGGAFVPLIGLGLFLCRFRRGVGFGCGWRSGLRLAALLRNDTNYGHGNEGDSNHPDDEGQEVEFMLAEFVWKRRDFDDLIDDPVTL